MLLDDLQINAKSHKISQEGGGVGTKEETSGRPAE